MPTLRFSKRNRTNNLHFASLLRESGLVGPIPDWSQKCPPTSIQKLHKKFESKHRNRVPLLDASAIEGIRPQSHGQWRPHGPFEQPPAIGSCTTAAGVTDRCNGQAYPPILFPYKSPSFHMCRQNPPPLGQEPPSLLPMSVLLLLLLFILPKPNSLFLENPAFLLIVATAATATTVG